MKYANLNAYMFEAMLGAIADMGYTPFIQVNTNKSDRDFSLPAEYIDPKGFINLNVSARSIKDYNIDKEKGFLYFSATFSGKHFRVVIPCESIVAVFAKENNKVVYIFKDMVLFLTGAGLVEGSEPEAFIRGIARYSEPADDAEQNIESKLDVKNIDDNLKQADNVVAFDKRFKSRGSNSG